MTDYIHELADGVYEVLDRVEAQRVQRDASISGQSALALLQAVYRDPEVPLSTRIRCAALALPHETPRLTAVANISPSEFADRLEECIRRSGVRLVEAKSANG
jgi:hypothetical protein